MARSTLTINTKFKMARSTLTINTKFNVLVETFCGEDSPKTVSKKKFFSNWFSEKQRLIKPKKVLIDPETNKR